MAGMEQKSFKRESYNALWFLKKVIGSIAINSFSILGLELDGLISGYIFYSVFLQTTC